jgi:hypothetical protein
MSPDSKTADPAVRQRASAHLSRREAILLTTSGCLGGLLGSLVYIRPFSAKSAKIVAASDAAPLRLHQYFPALNFTLSHNDRILLLEKLRLRPEMSASDLLHWLRIFATGPLSNGFLSESRTVLEDLTDSERLGRRFEGENSLVATPFGARYVIANNASNASRSRVAHAQQPLAVFGELGVRLARPLRLQEKSSHILSLLEDCLSNLQLREVRGKDVEWAATASILYLPPQTSWKNRWGETIRLEDLAAYLLDLPLSGCSCCGTHVLASLAILAQAQRTSCVMREAMMDRVTQKLKTFSDTLQRTQHPDGSWASDWSGDRATPDTDPRISLLVTGHLLEWQILLPPQLQTSPVSLSRALRYLARVATRAGESDVINAYCPFSHAAKVLLHWPPQL